MPKPRSPLVVSNGRKRRLRTNSASIPAPVSATSITARCPAARVRTVITPSPAVASWAFRTPPHRLSAQLGDTYTVCLLPQHAAPQLVHQACHALDRVVDGEDRIIEKLGVTPMARGILHDERLLRDEVAQIVHQD